VIWLDFLWILSNAHWSQSCLYWISIGFGVLVAQAGRNRISTGFVVLGATSFECGNISCFRWYTNSQILTLSFSLKILSTCILCFRTLFRRMYCSRGIASEIYLLHWNSLPLNPSSNEFCKTGWLEIKTTHHALFVGVCFANYLILLSSREATSPSISGRLRESCLIATSLSVFLHFGGQYVLMWAGHRDAPRWAGRGMPHWAIYSFQVRPRKTLPSGKKKERCVPKKSTPPSRPTASRAKCAAATYCKDSSTIIAYNCARNCSDLGSRCVHI
jgi:hypothetical protein